ncbi:MAG: hypothetical protein H7326_10125 [Bdellovibrionaceae bacterium]|nr:hypothetical protein [Pseudobdellovibrionaceae bacterium]
MVLGSLWIPFCGGPGLPLLVPEVEGYLRSVDCFHPHAFHSRRNLDADGRSNCRALANAVIRKLRNFSHYWMVFNSLDFCSDAGLYHRPDSKAATVRLPEAGAKFIQFGGIAVSGFRSVVFLKTQSGAADARQSFLSISIHAKSAAFLESLSFIWCRHNPLLPVGDDRLAPKIFLALPFVSAVE